MWDVWVSKYAMGGLTSFPDLSPAILTKFLVWGALFIARSFAEFHTADTFSGRILNKSGSLALASLRGPTY